LQSTFLKSGILGIRFYLLRGPCRGCLGPSKLLRRPEILVDIG